MSRRTQIKLKQLATIAGAWLVIGVLMAVYDHLVLLTASSQGPSTSYSFLFSLAMNSASALIGALLGGSFMVFYINVKYTGKSYGHTILAVSISFIIIILFIVTILGVVTLPLRTGRPLSDPVSIPALKNFLLDSALKTSSITVV